MFYNVTLHFMTTIIEKKLLTVNWCHNRIDTSHESVTAIRYYDNLVGSWCSQPIIIVVLYYIKFIKETNISYYQKKKILS